MFFGSDHFATRDGTKFSGGKKIYLAMFIWSILCSD